VERELAKECSECDMHYKDCEGIDRCKLYDDAILETTNEKHCKDSIF
jgi:hypothetical protein